MSASGPALRHRQPQPPATQWQVREERCADARGARQTLKALPKSCFRNGDYFTAITNFLD